MGTSTAIVFVNLDLSRSLTGRDSRASNRTLFNAIFHLNSA